MQLGRERRITRQCIRRLYKSAHLQIGKAPSSTLDPTCSGCGTVSNCMSRVIGHLENRMCSVRGWLDDYRPLFQALQQRIAEQKVDVHGCTVCPKTFINAQALEQHRRNKHKLTRCYSCLEVFEMTDARKHNAVHRGAANKQHFLCLDCRAKMEENDHLNRTCGPCGLTFEDKQSLENHDCEIHHMCRQCLQHFTTAEELYMVSQSYQDYLRNC